MKHFIIEGIDNIGKGTLIANIIDIYGFHQIIKYDKPRECTTYHEVEGIDTKSQALKAYQKDSFESGFDLLQRALDPVSFNKSNLLQSPLIFDRFHLGELVYSPIYRGYSGDYVFEIESRFLDGLKYAEAVHSVILVLLTTDDFSIIQEDGKSFDPTKKEIEQSLFLDAFKRSKLPKINIPVNDGAKFRAPNEILADIQLKIGL